MNSTITIRYAEVADAELLANFGRETFHDAFAGNPLMPQDDLRVYMESAFTISQMNSELNDPKTIFFLAEIEGEAVGYAKLERSVTTESIKSKNPIKLTAL
jgi:hypothetical protein